MLVLYLTLLAACSNLPFYNETLPAVANPQQAWQKNQILLSNLTQWNLEGKLSLTTKKKNTSVTIAWRQKKNHYRVELSAPFGQGDMLISGNTSKIKIITSEGKTVQGSNPQLVLYKNFNINIPVIDLQYWARGIPSPTTSITQLQINHGGYLKSFNQKNWTISYLSYQNTSSSLALPKEIILKNKQSKLKMFIKKWQ